MYIYVSVYIYVRLCVIMLVDVPFICVYVGAQRGGTLARARKMHSHILGLFLNVLLLFWLRAIGIQRLHNLARCVACLELPVL